MKSALCLLGLFLAVVFADIPEVVNNGYFEGRSGDLLLKPNVAKDESFMVFLGDNDGKVVVPKKELTLPETRVADLLAHLVGTAPLNPDVDRTDFPRKGFFNNPKANVMFVLDSTAVGAELDAEHHKITGESYPDDTVTALTSILTGATPSKHGIIAEAWLDRERSAKVSAFESWCPSKAGSRSATLQDVFGLAFGGRSLVLSFSAKLQIARALSTKPFLLKPTSPNHGFFWNGKGFESVYADKSKYTASAQEVLETFTRLGGASLALNELDLNVPEVALFVAEAGYALHLVELLSTDEELKALASDNVPDFFSFGFSTLKDLERKFGKASAELKTAAGVARFVMSTVVTKLNALYEGRVLAEAIFLGSSEETADAQVQILDKTRSALVAQLADEQHLADYYPGVYLNDELTPEQKEEACAFLRQVLDAASVEVYCLPSPSHFRSLRADLGNSSGDGQDEHDMEIFQIVLWSSIVLILTTIWAAAIMFTIDASKDTMVYNQHNQIHIKTIS